MNYANIGPFERGVMLNRVHSSGVLAEFWRVLHERMGRWARTQRGGEERSSSSYLTGEQHGRAAWIEQ
jgi:hypothetical protein